jgi:nucleoside-diphosphate-sugar epimerase
MARKIVVTGGSGRLGQHVIHELLDYDYDVLSLDRVAPQTEICSSRIVDLTHADDA